MSNPIPAFAQHHPGICSAVLVGLMMLVEWASRQVGRVREAAP